MTTLSLLPPPLERLFDRIDAAEPSDARLRALLEIWRARRLKRFLPTHAAVSGAVPDPIATHSFGFKRVEDARGDWQLIEAGEAASALFGHLGGGRRLADMQQRRLAVHLRRLFEFVRQTAEPVAATFGEHPVLGKPSRFEVVVAPLSSDGQRVDAVFGGIVGRQHEPAGRSGRGSTIVA